MAKRRDYNETDFFTHSFSSHIVLWFELAMMTPMQMIISQWLASLKHYLLMCLLLSSPDRLPYSPYSVMLTGLCYFLLGLLLVDPERSYTAVCQQILLELAMLGAITYCGLSLKQSLQRFLQTFSALLGINVIITAATIPVYRAVIDNANVGDNLLLTVTIVILAWNLGVLSLIFKRAFEISTHLSAVISFSYFIVYQITVYWITA